MSLISTISVPTKRFKLELEVFSEWKKNKITTFEKGRHYIFSIHYFCLAIIYKIKAVVEVGIQAFEKTDYINEPITSKKLAPIHIAVLSGNMEALRLLKEAGANMNQQDAQGWSLLHHGALLGNAEMMNFLETHCTQKETQTNQEGTYQHFLKLIKPLQKSPQDKIPVFQRNRKRELIQMTHGQFASLAKATYLEENQLKGEHLYEQWEGAEESKYQLYPFIPDLKKQYHFFLQNPLESILEPVFEDSQGKKLRANPGLGLFAKQSLQAFTIIGEFKGIYRESLLNLELDTQNARNEIGQIEDGFCNVSMIKVPNIHGLNHRYLIVTLEDIPSGEQFCRNYGHSHSVKLGSYCELRAKEARLFVKMFPFEECLSLLLKLESPEKIGFEDFAKLEKWRYILQTPPVFFSMILDETFTSSQAQKMWDFACKQHLINPQHPLDLLVKVASNCCKIKNQIKTTMPLTGSAYEESIRAFLETEGVNVTLLVEEKINSQIETFILPFCNPKVKDPIKLKEIDQKICTTLKSLVENNHKTVMNVKQHLEKLLSKKQ